MSDAERQALVEVLGGHPPSLAAGAVTVLTTAKPDVKAARSRALARLWQAGALEVGQAAPPARPARPAKPDLLPPAQMPRRRPGSPAGRIALIHAIAHIELNAIDLHWDIVARFPDVAFPMGFYDDWVLAAEQEAKHFQLLSARLAAMDASYGDLPAHDGLWQAAEETAEDIFGRLAVVPMVLEARGLDVTPGMIALFQKTGDAETVAALETIYAEEVGHVAYGSKWFHFLCGRHEMDPKPAFHALVRRYFRGHLKPPFNEEKRAEAGLAPDFYWPLVENSIGGDSI
ncbi:MAG: ferritin-like domain-containing protein [Pseudomonadota bacterium]